MTGHQKAFKRVHHSVRAAIMERAREREKSMKEYTYSARDRIRDRIYDTYDLQAAAFNKLMQAIEAIPGKYAARYKLYSMVRELSEAAYRYGQAVEDGKGKDTPSWDGFKEEQKAYNQERAARGLPPAPLKIMI